MTDQAISGDSSVSSISVHHYFCLFLPSSLLSSGSLPAMLLCLAFELPPTDSYFRRVVPACGTVLKVMRVLGAWRLVFSKGTSLKLKPTLAPSPLWFPDHRDGGVPRTQQPHISYQNGRNPSETVRWRMSLLSPQLCLPGIPITSTGQELGHCITVHGT